MRKILFVDDDESLQRALQAVFRAEFQLVHCATIAKAREALSEGGDIALAIIDRRLPDGDGLALSTEIRNDAQHASLPIIFLSGLASESDRISGFYAGADDYVTKPFSILELKARVSARLRASAPTRIAVGALEIDIEGHRVFDISKPERPEVLLTRTELKLLIVFAQAIGEVVSRESLLLKVWGNETHVNDRVIDSHISHLRKKIQVHGLALESLRGEGYRLDIERNSKAEAV